MIEMLIALAVAFVFFGILFLFDQRRDHPHKQTH